MKDGAIVCNSGHFDVELDLPGLHELAASDRPVRPFVQEFKLRSGRRVNLLGEGRLINLAAAEGHPADVMDMSFANQALAAEMIARNPERLPAAVHRVPLEVDREVARLKLEAMGVPLQKLTPEQERYLDSWEEGT
jgi:adenosylhomocysteinase